MLEKDETGPSKADVENILVQLVHAEITREEAANWASQWVSLPDPPVSDMKVWKAIEQLSGADLISTDRPYLYENDDFQAWLDELRK